MLRSAISKFKNKKDDKIEMLKKAAIGTAALGLGSLAYKTCCKREPSESSEGGFTDNFRLSKWWGRSRKKKRKENEKVVGWGVNWGPIGLFIAALVIGIVAIVAWVTIFYRGKSSPEGLPPP